MHVNNQENNFFISHIVFDLIYYGRTLGKKKKKNYLRGNGTHSQVPRLDQMCMMHSNVCKKISLVFLLRIRVSSCTRSSITSHAPAPPISCHVYTCLFGTWLRHWISSCRTWTPLLSLAPSDPSPQTTLNECATGDYPQSDWSRSTPH